MRGWRTPLGPRPAPAELLVRLAVAGALVLCLAHFLAAPILRAAVPAIHVVFELVDDHFVVLDLAAVENEGHEVVRMRADFARPTYVNGYRLMPHGEHPGQLGGYEVLITSGGALQGSVVAFIALLAWPARSVRHLLKRLLIAAPVVATFAVFDIALCLLANLWMPLVQDWNPSGFWPSVTWAKLLDGGGRFALAFVLAAWIVVSVRDRSAQPESGA